MKLLRLPEVLAKTAKTRSGLYADPTFPRPVKIGDRAVAWVEAEVDDWITAKIAARQPVVA